MGNSSSSEYSRVKDLSIDKILKNYTYKRGKTVVYGLDQYIYGYTTKEISPNESNIYCLNLGIIGLSFHKKGKITINLDRHVFIDDKDKYPGHILYYFEDRDDIDNEILKLMSRFCKSNRKVNIRIYFEYDDEKENPYKRYLFHDKPYYC